MPNKYLMVCVGGVILIVSSAINHVRKDLYYAIILIVINRINNIINPIVLLIVIQNI